MFLDVRALRVTWTVLVCLGVIALVYLLRHALLLLVLSVFFAYLVFPLVRLVQRWVPGLRHRALAIAVVYALLLLALVGVGTAAGPRLAEEVQRLTEKLPQVSEQIQSGELVGRVLQRRGWGAEIIEQVQQGIRLQARGMVTYAQGAAAALLKWLAGAWTIVLIPIFAFFILKDAERLTEGVAAVLARRRYRQLWRAIAADVHDLLAGYVRALILLSLVTFVAWSGVFLLAGLPYALVLAALGGALEFISLVGPLTAGAIVLSVALFAGYAHPWALLIFLLGWRGIQDYVTSPLLMGRGVEIHPGLVVFGVIAGGELAGPAGMFLSVPVIAALRIVWRRVRAFERETDPVPSEDAPPRPRRSSAA